MTQTTVEVKDNITKILDDNNNFYGTGFFIQKEYCVTCHHVICRINEINIKHKADLLHADWAQDLSIMEKDIAILRVRGGNVKPLECAKETTPLVRVSVLGFTRTTNSSLPLGREVIGDLNTIPTEYEAVEERIVNRNKPWTKKPKVCVSVYQLETSYAGVGLSGAPVWESNRGKIVGMFIATQGLDPYNDVSTVGYMIPIEVILELVDPSKKKIHNPSSNIDTASFLRKGNEYLLEQHYEEAIENYDEIIEDPNLVNALNNKATALDKLKRYEDVFKCYDILTGIYEDNVDIWYAKGLSLYKLKRYQDANKCYDKALEFNRNYPYAWNNKGVILADSEKYEDALKLFDKFIEINPNYANVWYNKGVCYLKLEKYEDVLKCAEKALSLDPDYARAWHLKGSAQKKLTGFDAAEETFRKAHEIAHKSKDIEDEDGYPISKGKGNLK